jgi:dihydrofolate reductase/thymidylate synthase
MFNIILATNWEGGIGFKGKLPWSFKTDMMFFKNKTTNLFEKSVVIMGRNTWESLPNKFLPNRKNYIITSQDLITDNNDISFFKSLNAALIAAYKNTIDHENIWVIGGAKLYNEAFRHKDLKYVYHTQVCSDSFKCDTFVDRFDNWDIENNYLVSDIDRNTGENRELNFYKYKIKPNAEIQYLKLLEKVYKKGVEKEGRNGITKSLFGEELKFDVSKNFPLLTTKKMFLRGIIEELLFFIRGETDSSKLSEKCVRIWEGNTSREFLDMMGHYNPVFKNYKVGEMGPMYGYQWRFFNKPYGSYIGGIDQFKNLIEEIKSNPNSRRLLMTDFNPAQVQEGVLFPCHSLILQFYVEGNKLSVKMYQRSGDLFLGVPFNIASTTLLLYIVAKLTNKNPHNVIITFGDCHIYEEHFEQVERQLNRTPFILPKMTIKDFKTIKDVEHASIDDFVLHDYECHKGIKAQMIA